MTRRVGLCVFVALAAGCADARVCHRCPAAGGPPGGEPAYRVGCGDVLEVLFADRPGWDCLASVGIDGRLPLGGAGDPLVQGATPDEVREAVAATAGVAADRVGVRVADARAARVWVTGPEAGRRRAVPYRGPEPVVAFVARVGAVKPGCSELHAVYVTRPNAAAGLPPETFHVDVEGVVLDDDHRTDVVLRPGDEVFVGETRRSVFGRLLPRWLRPLYRRLVGLAPPDRCPGAR